MKKICLVSGLLIISALMALYAVNISVGQTVTQNFDGIGTSATATMPTDWKADRPTNFRTVGTYSTAGTKTEQRAGNSMTTNATYGIYNFGAGDATSATDRAVGGLSSSNVNGKGVNIYVKLTNNGSSDISSFTISYNVEKYRMGSNPAGFTIQMYYSFTGNVGDWTSAGDDFKTSFNADGSNAGYTSAPGVTVQVSNKTLSQSLAAGSSLYLAWNYSVTSGSTTSSAQALGIDDVSITANGETSNPSISVDPSSLTDFSYVHSSGPSSEKSFSLTGSNLTANLTVSISADAHFEISSASGGTFSNSLSYTPSEGSVSATVYVRMKAGLLPGTYSDETITCASTGATSRTVSCSGIVYKGEPTNYVTNFTASEVGASSITLTWTDASKYTPDGYLIKGSDVGFNNITAPVDGTPVNDGILTKNVTAGTQTCTFTGLSENTTYYFKIYPYTNSGSAINYKTDGEVPQTNATTLDNPNLNPGDIAILGFQSDTPDKFAFIVLTDLSGGTEIKFTDNGWKDNNTLYANEGTLTWTAPSDGIDKGSIITVSNESGWTATSGSITSSGSIAFAGGGDQIIVYQGTSSSPTLIYAFSTSPWITSGTIGAGTSYLPSGLSNGTTAHCFSSTYDNGFYTNETIIESKASALSSISNDENWTKSDTAVTFPSWTYQEEQTPLPVVLTSFTATISNQNYINLTWITQSETGMMGYYVMRSTQNDLSTAKVVSPLIPATNTSQPKAYLYTDTEVTESGTYYYWLQCNDYDGIINTYGSISIEYNPGGGNTTPSIPLVTELLPVFPNPFNPQLFIPFNLANKLEVKIIIYNTRGQIVKEIPVGEQNPGNYRIEWDGKDSKGQALPTGIYCIRMIAGKDYYQTKAILMK